MVKEMKPWWCSNKHSNLVAKFAILILLMGFAGRFLFFGSNWSASVTVDVEDTSTSEKSELQNPPVSVPTPVTVSASANDALDPPVIEDQLPQNQNESVSGSSDDASDGDQLPNKGSVKCDLFTGDWIPNPSGPVYTNQTCHFLEDHQNCMRNGRPDTDYLYWRWSPRDCELPQFDAPRFLEMMRNKSWAFIGDSISRNHVQSFLCMLSQVEEIIEIYHDKDYKNRRWQFPSYNFTVSITWSPFLVKADIFEDINGVSTSEIELHLDKLDSKWTDLFMGLDYIIFSTGKWFLKTAVYHEDDKIVGCHYCPKRNLTELGFEFAYRRALSSVFSFIMKSKHKGMIFFRTSTPDHFENGEWFSGGTCQKTAPLKEGEIEMKQLNSLLRAIELEEYETAAKKASENGVDLKLLDVAPLSLLRPDGHPGAYRHFHPFAKNNKAKVIYDCLHWCLPGPIDAWNDVIMDMLVNG
ncbi:Trichome birefringence-like, N-terminal domain [Dillenia turbinata]|uniref:Trichome birefringence-like, N-terminal domain n=1 Tax=Dillenia turbinata TaxID=194707 RepID=A0AAN8ZRY8_9MAGN